MKLFSRKKKESEQEKLDRLMKELASTEVWLEYIEVKRSM